MREIERKIKNREKIKEMREIERKIKNREN